MGVSVRAAERVDKTWQLWKPEKVPDLIRESKRASWRKQLELGTVIPQELQAGRRRGGLG